MIFQPDAQQTIYKEILDHISLEQVRAMASLDANRRVIVQGAAGTGKTRLAISWAKRARDRGERTLLTCYNDPLADFLKSILEEQQNLVIRPFLRQIKELDGINELSEPTGPRELDKFWNETLPNHVLANLENIEPVFETIVVDELQDFAQSWIEILEAILVPNGRLLGVADMRQDIFGRGYQPPQDDPLWTNGRLEVNCRNTRQIGLLLKKIGGAQPATACPIGDPVRFISIRSEEEAISAVENLLAGHINFHKRRPSEIVIVCKTQSERQKLRQLSIDNVVISNWESRNQEHVACETFRRIKGLEADHIVVVAFDGDLIPQELYVAASRARSSLAIIASPRIGEYLGLR